jgi:hypothetical protein
MIISASCYISSAVLAQLPTNDVLLAICVCVILFVMIIGLEGHTLSLYMYFSNFETALRAKVASENKESLMKAQTEEMRHMIGIYE